MARGMETGKTPIEVKWRRRCAQSARRRRPFARPLILSQTFELANGKARAGRTIAGPVKAAPFESPSADVRGYPRLFTFR